MIDLATVAGLSSADAAARLASEGPNELAFARRRTFLRGLLDVVREPMTALLVGCGAIYFLLGDRQEVLMLLGFVLLIVGITLYQERKTEHAIEALRDLASPRALVIRDGSQQRIAGRDVVRDDVLVLNEGDRVAADGVVLSTTSCSVDESLLTGESVAVRKRESDGTATSARPGGDDLPFVYAGTLVVQGAALVQVTTTGERTEMGKIGRVLGSTLTEATRLQRETKSLVWKLAIFAGVLSVAVIVVYGLTRHDWLHGLLAGLTLAMAILPNEFPVVVTIFLALGAWRLSKRRVLTRRIPAVEALGSVTVLCVDKTGTLTQNRMTVSRIAADGETFDVGRLPHDPLPEAFHRTMEYKPAESARVHSRDPHPGPRPDGGAILAGWPLVLMPIHIAFLHLVIDPACSVVFEAEPEEADVMRRPPRSLAARLFGRKLVAVSLSLGLSVTVILIATFAIVHYAGRGELEARAITFTTLILANLALIFTNRSWSTARKRTARNSALWWIVGGTLALLAAILYVPSLRALFRFNVLHPIDLAVCVGAAAIGTLWFEALKLIQRRRPMRPTSGVVERAA